MRLSGACSLVLLLSACPPRPDDTGGSGSSTTSATESGTSLAATGSTSEQPTGTAGSTASGSSSTGGAVSCDPPPAAIPLEEFPNALATAVCEQKKACGCEVDFACEGVWAGLADQLVAYGLAQGAAYDGACAAAAIVNYVEAQGCNLKSVRLSSLPCEDCPAFKGTIPEGVMCDNSFPEYGGLVEPCAGEGLCIDGCQVLDPLELGAPCYVDNKNVGLCSPGSACDYAGSMACEALTDEPGADCTGAELCDPKGLFCNAQGVCEARRPEGATCDSPVQCASVRCNGGVCVDYVRICDATDLAGLRPY